MCVISCAPSRIWIAIFDSGFQLSSSQKLSTLCHRWHRHNRTQHVGWSYLDKNLILHNVRHVPELTRPLVSVGQLDENGISADFSSGGWNLHGGNLLLARGPKVNPLYPLYVTLREGDLFFVDIPVSSLWLGRLNHLSKVGIAHLSRAVYIPLLL